MAYRNLLRALLGFFLYFFCYVLVHYPDSLVIYISILSDTLTEVSDRHCLNVISTANNRFLNRNNIKNDHKGDVTISQELETFQERFGISCNGNLSLDKGCCLRRRHLPPEIEETNLVNQAKHIFQQIQRSTVLVVAFNGRLSYHVAPLIYSIYGHIFSQIRFCGPSNAEEFVDKLQPYFDYSELPRLTQFFKERYLQYQIRPPLKDGVGETIYYCAYLAVKSVGVDISGVVLMHDDVIFNYWKFLFEPHLFPLEQSYSFPLFDHMTPYNIDTLECEDDSKEQDRCLEGKVAWSWAIRYQKHVRSFYDELTDLSNVNKTSIYARSKRNLAKRAGGERRTGGSLADLFYIAKRDLLVAMEMIPLLAKHGIFQEIAVPTLFASFDQLSGVIDTAGNQIMGHNYWVLRSRPWEFVDATQLMFHPFKLSPLFSTRVKGRSMQVRCIYCVLTNYAQYIAQHFATV